MKNFFKRLRLSQWLIICQLFASIIMLAFMLAGSEMGEIVGMIWNILNGLAVLVAFVFETARNVKYYEITGQFVFNKLGESFSAFMDFLMSEEYKKMPFEEHRFFEEKLLEVCKNDTYDMRRKISRAIPYLYEIDAKMAMEIIAVLRWDTYKEMTDIRRRCLEAVLTIIQKQESPRKRKTLYKKFENLFAYHQNDDGYTVVACLENYYYAYAHIATTEREKENILIKFETLKIEVKKAKEAQIGKIDDGLAEDMDCIWQTLKSLSALGGKDLETIAIAKKYIEEVLENGGKYSKLTVVKNLYYTCPNYPQCLIDHKCSADTTSYMMQKIYGFLTNALNKDQYLAMPTVRYFDCVCNNIYRADAKERARSIIREYFSSPVLLINQTAFDKFAKLLKEDRDFAKEVLTELLLVMNEKMSEEAAELAKKIG